MKIFSRPASRSKSWSNSACNSPVTALTLILTRCMPTSPRMVLEPLPGAARSARLENNDQQCEDDDPGKMRVKKKPMRTIAYRDALREALREEMLRDESVYILGEDIAGYGGTYSVTKGLFEEFGEKRVKDTPLAEEIIIGTAIGSALGGLRPIAELMTMNFSLLASDLIVNSAAKFRYMFGGQPHVPMVVRMPAGGGAQRGAQHSQFFESWYAHIPGLKVVMPATPYDAKGMLKSAVRDDDPVLFIEHELLYSVKGEVPDEGEEYTIPLDRGEIKREGRDVTLVTFSRMLH